MKAVKWIAIIVGCLIVLLVVAIITVPMLVDVNRFKPEIEKRVAEATGRPFTLGGDLDVSVFPWVGVSLSDLHLGNPPDFKERDFIKVESFEVRVKLLPLISRNVEVRRFVMRSPHIVLIRRNDGVGNWEGLGKAAAETLEEEKDQRERRLTGESPIKGLVVGEFAITNGRVLWIDQAQDTQKELSDFNLRLDDISPERPINLNLSAKLDNQPISLQGTVGPTGLDPSKGVIPVELAIKIFDELNMQLKGTVSDPGSLRQFEFALQVSPFSPREMMKSLDQEFTLPTADPQALSKVALQAQLKGDDKNISLSNGLLDLDQSKIHFNLEAKEFEKPNLSFNLNLDQIDLDRYLPPAGEKQDKTGADKSHSPAERKKPDYKPLRKLVLNGEIKIGQLKAHGARAEDITMRIAGRGGQIRLDPMSMKLYQGALSSTGLLDVRQDVPRSNINLQTKGIQAGPLVNDLVKRDIIEGTLESKINLTMTGDDPERIKASLNGQGNLIFRDGAIKGIDLASMVRNVQAAFGLAEKGGERPRTDFAEFSAPFTLTNGVFNTDNTNLMSPLLRVTAKGKANLVSEALDFRVEPKAVATLKGQDDTVDRRGVTVPVLVGGTFQSPTFKPDLAGMIKGTLPSPSQLKDTILGPAKEGEPSKSEEPVRELLRKIPFGR